MSKLSKILVIAFVCAITVLITTLLLLNKNKPQTFSINFPQQQQNLSFNIKSSQSNINIGDKTEVSVYLTGNQAQDINAFDLKLDYDRTKLSLVSATPGGFFAKYLEVKWDTAQAWFSLARNPSESISNSATPLLTFEFLAASQTDSTPVSISPSSSVYISQSGSVYPSTNQINFIVK